MREHRVYHWDVRYDLNPWSVTIHAADSIAGAHVSRQTPATVSMVLSATPDYEMAKAQGRCVQVTAVPVSSPMPAGDWNCLGFVTLSFPQKQEQVALFYRQVSERPVVLDTSPRPAAPPLESKAGSGVSSSVSNGTRASGSAQSQERPRSSGSASGSALPGNPGAAPAPTQRNTPPAVTPAVAPRGTGA